MGCSLSFTYHNYKGTASAVPFAFHNERDNAMTTKPGWPLFFAWLIAYLILDLLFDYAFRGHLAWEQLPESLSGAIFAAILTWLFALRKWARSDSTF